MGSCRGHWKVEGAMVPVHSGNQPPSLEDREVAHSVLCRISVRVSEVWKKREHAVVETGYSVWEEQPCH